jgi:hypothetical protein
LVVVAARAWARVTVAPNVAVSVAGIDLVNLACSWTVEPADVGTVEVATLPVVPEGTDSTVVVVPEHAPVATVHVPLHALTMKATGVLNVTERVAAVTERLPSLAR